LDCTAEVGFWVRSRFTETLLTRRRRVTAALDDTRAMHAARRSTLVKRGLFAAALAVGRGVAWVAEAVTVVVRRASRIEEPSPEATAAAIVRGVTALAPKTIGGPIGTGVELAGAGAVLAIATFALAMESDGAALEHLLTSAITDAEIHGLCSARASSLWRASVAVHRGDHALLELELARLVERVVPAASIESIAVAVGKKNLSRAIAGCAPDALRLGLGGLALGRTLGGAWRAMGEAARLVEATRRFAALRAHSRDLDVVTLPARAA
jgi:hypothetical protein